ncbi:MAG: tRNA (guanosine(46)-N7)-methyltransferase TrmB [Alphaproteobacteria bacterium]
MGKDRPRPSLEERLELRRASPEKGGPDGLKRLWGRRQSFKLSARQEQLFQSLLPRIQIILPDSSVPGSIDPVELFAHPSPGRSAPALSPPAGRGKGEGPSRVSLEIGFGGGEHLCAWAKRHPDEGFIGAEHFINGLAKMLTHVDEEKLANIRLFAGDARRLVETLKDASLDRVFILFPDPWPKKRHHKRRYVQDDTLEEIARVLKDGGTLRIASDIPDYIEWTLEHVAKRAEFMRTRGSLENAHERPADWPPTRYEQKALREGRLPQYLDYRRAKRMA